MNRVEIGKRLLACREKVGKSRAEVSNIVNVGTTTLRQWEVGATETSIETVEKLAQLYNVTPQYIIFGDTDAPSSPASDIAALSAAQGISVEEAIDTLKTMIQDAQPKLTEEEAFLLKEFRALDDDQRRMMLRFIIGGFDSLNSGGGNKGVFSSPHAKIEDSFKG